MISFIDPSSVHNTSGLSPAFRAILPPKVDAISGITPVISADCSVHKFIHPKFKFGPSVLAYTYYDLC